MVGKYVTGGLCKYLAAFSIKEIWRDTFPILIESIINRHPLPATMELLARNPIRNYLAALTTSDHSEAELIEFL